MGSGDVCLLTEVRGRLGHGEKHPSPIKLTEPAGRFDEREISRRAGLLTRPTGRS